MLRKAYVLSVLSLALGFAGAALAAEDLRKGVTDPANAGPDFATQGEYTGQIKAGDGSQKVGVQVIARGDGKFHIVNFMGGLPGDGWNLKDRAELDSEFKDGVVIFGKIDKLEKVIRKSPTLGEKPPTDAVILFDGTSANAFKDGRMSPDKLLMEGATSKQLFKDFKIHLEFMIPFMPYARGQGRGNSGFYAQGRYEVQILDSFGLPSKTDECGGIYKVGQPPQIMSYPPLSWQTYDVDFTAAEWKDGKKVKNARMTVVHNGVQIHKDIEIPHATTASPLREGPADGPIYLQNHGNPVRFRNIWLIEKK